MSQLVVERADFGALFDALVAVGYTLVGPTVSDGAIVYDELSAVGDLPIGWTDEQDGGIYRLRRRDDEALFGYAVGPHSWKKYLFPPRVTLWDAQRDNGSLSFVPARPDRTRYAFIGVRACELAAIAVQDAVFLDPAHVDSTYATVRSGMFTVAVNCIVAGGTCFCVSMETGPRCDSGFDLLVTEVIGAGRHEFVLEGGSAAGDQILATLPGRPAGRDDTRRVDAIVDATASSMGRSIDTEGIKELLYANQEHSQWDDVAERCLACTNCTLVCPTCFCSSTEDATDLIGNARRTRRWDSCFTLDFSSLHRVPVRSSTRSRYRQWMTHKLASWYDQFGTSGCVGCGRCVTWCPVGIDITKEVAAIRGERRS